MAQTAAAPMAQHPAPLAPIHLIARGLPGRGLEALCCGARPHQIPPGRHDFTTNMTKVTCPAWQVSAEARAIWMACAYAGVPL
jgi:hypothetical protein